MLYILLYLIVLLMGIGIYWNYMDDSNINNIIQRLKEKTKSATKYLVVIVIVIPQMFLGLILILNESDWNREFILILLSMITFIIFIESGAANRVWNRIKLIFVPGRREIQRQLPDYSVAVASYLQNFRIESKKDAISTILSLCSKKAIRIVQQGKDIVIVKTNKDFKLTEDEMYFYDYITNPYSKNTPKGWIECIKKQVYKLGFAKKCNNHIVAMMMIILVISINLFFKYIGLEDEVSKTLSMIFGSAMLFSIILIIPTLAYHEMKKEKLGKPFTKYTYEGIKEVKKIYGLKKFIKEYSLLSQREIEEVYLWEEYLSYAIALNNNKKYRGKLVKELNEYMNVNINNEYIFDIKIRGMN